MDAVVHRLPGISPNRWPGASSLLADPVRLASRQAAADRYRAARACAAQRFLRHRGPCQRPAGTR
ncbi:protein of unknown function [Denitratisoma oestradiolicum]|uniref:Uncharacterized protein n=1 Tax=Denitratisoma oestradiolicum TaxID=311182 RepID=A0A6S6XSQ2_9PROT|nr:protein of unknown function [Denitratisoma oestradiolicum]